MSRIPLPDDQWAELREVSEFKQKDRRIAAGAWNSELTVALQIMDHTDRVIILALTNWSLDIPKPTIDDPSSLGALDFATYDALQEAVQPILAAMRGEKDKLGSPKDAKDSDSPTGPSTV